jgi:hypothetical protein
VAYSLPVWEEILAVYGQLVSHIAARR